MGELQQGDSDVGIGEGQPSERGTAQVEQRQLREDGGIDVQYQSSLPTQGHMLQAGTCQSSRDMREQAIQERQRNLLAREESHALARQALEVMRALEPPQADDLGTFRKAVENSHALQKFWLQLGDRRGNAEKALEKPE